MTALARLLDRLIPGRAARQRLEARVAQLERELATFREGLPALLGEYRGHYAAVLQGYAATHNQLLEERFRREALEEVLVVPGSARKRLLDAAYLRRLEAARLEGEKQRRAREAAAAARAEAEGGAAGDGRAAPRVSLEAAAETPAAATA